MELVNGNLEVLPMPTLLHQGILRFLHKILDRFVENENRGTVYFAPLRVRIRDKTFREPDIVYVASEHFALLGEKYLRGADLVMEIVSPDDKSQARDYQEKRIDYAALGITEYWIVDPKVQRITVLVLEEKQYRTHGEFSLGEEATSVLLDGFKVDVASVIAAGQIPA